VLVFKLFLTLFDGKRCEQATPAQLEMAQNAMKRLKTLRHPCILAFVDGVETEKEIFIVTEPVTSLMDSLTAQRQGDSEEQFVAGMAWGLHCLTSALGFINESAKLIHGNLHTGSIFVTENGDWKLGGFELLGAPEGGSPSALFQQNEGIVPAHVKSPEWQRKDWAACGKTTHAVDVWALGTVVYEVFNGTAGGITAAALKSAKGIPADFKAAFSKVVAEDPARRPAPTKIGKVKFVSDAPLVQDLQFFEEAQIKSPFERHQFFNSLPTRLDQYPRKCKAYKIIPHLIVALQYDTGSTATGGSAATVVLPTLVKLAALLPEEDYKERIVPTICKLFTNNDRAMRVALLQLLGQLAVGGRAGVWAGGRVGGRARGRAGVCVGGREGAREGGRAGGRVHNTTHSIRHTLRTAHNNGTAARTHHSLTPLLCSPCCIQQEHLTEELVNTTIFDNVVSGFSDAAPALRELTVKAMLPLATKLNSKNMNERVVGYFAAMQKDPEPQVGAGSSGGVFARRCSRASASPDTGLANSPAHSLPAHWITCFWVLCGRSAPTPSSASAAWPSTSGKANARRCTV
jgi:hypothetical protein